MTSAVAVVVDDHVLVRILQGDEPRALRPRGARLFTTGLWYHRLCRAVNAQPVVGTMSRLLGGTDEPTTAAAIRAIASLPDTVGLVSLRDLAWPMADLLRDGVRLNLLSLEALAAAEMLDAELCLSVDDDNPTLASAARARNVTLRLI